MEKLAVMQCVYPAPGAGGVLHGFVTQGQPKQSWPHASGMQGGAGGGGGGGGGTVLLQLFGAPW